MMPSARSLPFLILILLPACALGQRALPVESTRSRYVGSWETDFGVLVLRQEGVMLKGTYGDGGAATLRGTVEGSKLTFRYVEAGEKGEGWFELDPKKGSFAGKYRPDGEEAWAEWTGTRVARRVVVGPPFAGLFETRHGRVRLRQKGDRVSGIYQFSGTVGTLEGTAHQRRLTFTWREGEDRGDGRFDLAADRVRLTGRWRKKGEAAWKDWNGQRVTPRPGVRWLMVLESYWEESLEQSEYSFGAMLRAYLRRFPRIQVRRRRFADKADFVRAASKVALLAEPVVVVVASHGEHGALLAGEDRVGAKTIGKAFKNASNLMLLHFSACEMMVRKVPRRIWNALGRRVPISGYGVSVDWSASAVLEFLYLDLVLGKGKPPREAAKIVKQELRFAGDEGTPGSPLGGARFRFME